MNEDRSTVPFGDSHAIDYPRTSVPSVIDRDAVSDRKLIMTPMRRWLAGEERVPSCMQIIKTWGLEFEMYRFAWKRGSYGNRSLADDVHRSASLHNLRDECIKEFGFALPCAELLDAMAAAQPIVEIGAGSGYMTALARHAGIDIVGTDARAGHRFGFVPGGFDPRQEVLAGKTAVRRYRDRTVFCSWPSLSETWFRQALRAMRIGQRIIIVREDACAEDTAWDYLDICFAEEAIIQIPAWPFLNDYAGVWRKKRQGRGTWKGFQ
jgi:hypothetical protein